jgi:hypothetical protein
MQIQSIGKSKSRVRREQGLRLVEWVSFVEIQVDLYGPSSVYFGVKQKGAAR